jgi:hypothetical protein
MPDLFIPPGEFWDGRLDVSEIRHIAAETLECGLELSVAEGARAHVDATTVLTEVHRDA